MLGCKFVFFFGLNPSDGCKFVFLGEIVCLISIVADPDKPYPQLILEDHFASCIYFVAVNQTSPSSERTSPSPETFLSLLTSDSHLNK